MLELTLNLAEVYEWLGDVEKDYLLRTEVLPFELCLEILKEARKLCPVDTGRLRDSGEVIQLRGGDYCVQFSAPYALAVHEDMSARHTVGQAKFLDIATYKVLGGWK